MQPKNAFFIGLVVAAALLLFFTKHSLDTCHDGQRVTKLQLSLAQRREADALKPAGISTSKKTLNLLFHLNFLPVDQGGQIFETEWIENVVFGAVDRPVRVIMNPDKFYDDSVSVFLFSPPGDMFSKMKQQGLVNFGAYLMGDEQMDHSLNFIGDTSFTFRNYYNRDHLARYHNLFYVPLGVKIGLHAPSPTTFIPASKRRYLCNFVGSIRSNRAYMMDQLHYKRDSCYISADKAWADPAGVHVLHYRNVLLDSKFTLAPFGNNEESLRLYEALEFGSIPIAETSKSPVGDFINDGIGGLPPIIRVADWKELNAVLEHYDKNPAELDVLQANVVAWWQKKRSDMQHLVKKTLDDSFRRAYHADV